MKDFDRINECKYLYLENLSEPEDNSLRVIALETAASKLDEKSLAPPVSGAIPITHARGHSIFEIEWSSYIAYSVRNESYSTNGIDEYRGNLLRLCSKSSFLDYITASTIATFDYPGPYQHWCVVCLNHVVDVVSTSYPTVVLRVSP
jgi:hypothetical protein